MFPKEWDYEMAKKSLEEKNTRPVGKFREGHFSGKACVSISHMVN